MPASDGDESEKPQSHIPESAAALFGAMAGWRLGPAGALSGAAAGPYLVDFARNVWDEIRPDAQRRQGEMLGAAAEAAGQDLGGLAGMIGRSERTRLMTGIAMTGAAGTAWPPKVYALGRALADGLIPDDDQVNIVDLVLPAMADMDRPHVSLLELLIRWVPDAATGYLQVRPYPGDLQELDAEGPDRSWTASQIGEARPMLRPVVTSLIGTLLRHGLVTQNDNIPSVLAKYADELSHHWGNLESSAPMPEFATRRIMQPPSWSPTPLGKQVLEYYRIAGDEFAEAHALTPGMD
jgi:hypothetical protein